MSLELQREDDAALSLTQAVVTASRSPLLLLDGRLRILAASASFGRTFGVDPLSARGREIFSLGAGEWDQPELRGVLRRALADGREGEEVEMEFPGPGGRRLAVHAERLEYLDLNELRLLVAVADLTDSRAEAERAEALRRRNALLLQETRHRIANSLQIIASVLLHDARKSLSEEARSRLHSAHHRVMSVATLERHLSSVGEEEVQLRPYLTTLCETIGASMIRDTKRISFEAVIEDRKVDANVAVGLGLIATELVFNALKHAFPDGRAGKITVAYATVGAGWALTVLDDGVGLPEAQDGGRQGLGSGIVQGLAKQLHGHVVLSSRPEGGVEASVIHQAGEGGP